jgi:hypothetical protein
MSVTTTGFLAKSGPSDTMVPDALIIASTAFADVTIVETVLGGLPTLSNSEAVVARPFRR